MDIEKIYAKLLDSKPPFRLDAADEGLPEAFGAFLKKCGDMGINIISVSKLECDRALSFSAKINDVWEIEGINGVQVRLVHLDIKIERGSDVTACVMTGALEAFSQSAASVLEYSADEEYAWRLRTDEAMDISFADISDAAGEMMAVLPPSAKTLIDTRFCLEKGMYGIRFGGDFGTAMQTFTLTKADLSWDIIPGTLCLDGIFLRGTAGARFSLTIGGSAIIADKKLSLAVSDIGAPQWSFQIRSDNFPSLSDMAGWIGGGTDVAEAFSAVSLDMKAFDASITSIVVRADVFGGEVKDVTFTGTLGIGALLIDAEATLPDLSCKGHLHEGEPVKIGKVIQSLGIFGSAALPDAVANAEISEAVFAAELRQKHYSVYVCIDTAWTLGPVTLTEIYFQLDYFNTLTGCVRCSLEVCETARVRLEGSVTDEGFAFEGGLSQDSKLGMNDVIRFLSDRFDVKDVPDVVKSMEVDALYVTYGANGAFSFLCGGKLDVSGTKLEAYVNISAGGGKPAEFTGSLKIGAYLFDVKFADIKGEKNYACLCASYRHTGEGTTVFFASLIANISADAARVIPEDLRLDLRQITLLFFKGEGGSKLSFAVGLGLGIAFDFTGLPVIGHQLPADLVLSLDDLKIGYNTEPFTKDDAELINPILPDFITPMSKDGMTAGLFFGGALKINGEALTLLAGTETSQTPALQQKEKLPVSTKWLNIQKQLGAVTLSRVGVRFSGEIISFLIDASLEVGPLLFTVDGLSLGSRLDSFSLSAGINGFGVSYTSPELSVGGSVTQVEPASGDIKWQFDGSLTIQAGDWGLSALASYAVMESGEVSLFIFADANVMLGGPPYFTITGLLGGMGLNRRIRYPGFDEVSEFPLLNMDKPYSPAQMLSFLSGASAPQGSVPKKWLEISEGSYWLAAGVKFTSFELIKGKLMLSVQLGKTGTEIAVLGIASMTLPKGASQAESFAFVELQLSAVLKVDEGSFVLGASLTKSSFLLYKDCQLRGGFAFCIWFGKNPNAGQFVLTAGGYHPAFKPPSYYPSVDRVGFNWSVSKAVTIKGGAYLAVTPSCAMAGGSLEVEYNLGGLRAWFTAYANFLVTWNPFSFLGEIGIEVGASYTFDFFGCEKTLGFSIGASLTIWGPPIGGIVEIDLFIVSFRIKFGSREAFDRNRKPLSWDEFAQTLPAQHEVCTIQISNGLQRIVEKENGAKHHIVSGKNFSFFTVTAIPYGSDEGISIRPMNLENTKSTHTVTIYRNGTEVDISGWREEPVIQPVPESLWGKPLRQGGTFVQNPSQPTANVINGLGTGVFVTAPPFTENGGFTFENYGMHLRHTTHGPSPLDESASASGVFLPSENEEALDDISRMADADSRVKRKTLCDMLRSEFDLEAGGFEVLAGRAYEIFRDMPLEAGK